MPKLIVAENYSAEDLIKLGGVEKAYEHFFARVWGKELKFLHDGRKHVTRIVQQKHVEVPNQPGAYTLALHVWHCLADPAEAKVGEHVYERSLMASGEVDKASQTPKTAFKGWEFARDDDGWKRKT